MKRIAILLAALLGTITAMTAYADRRIEPEKMCPRTPCLLPDLIKVNPCKAHPGSCK